MKRVHSRDRNRVGEKEREGKESNNQILVKSQPRGHMYQADLPLRHTVEKFKWRGKTLSYIHTVHDLREQGHYPPQCCSSNPSEQSCLKSHTLLWSTHSPCAPHTNCPSGQMWGWTVGASVGGKGVVGLIEGRSPETNKYTQHIQQTVTQSRVGHSFTCWW
jgi:hypothetical protein